MASGRACHQQARHVGRRDQQQQADGAEQEQRGRSQVAADEIVAQRRQRDADVAVGIRVVALEAGGDRAVIVAIDTLVVTRELTAAVREIKQELPMKVCACLGLLTDEQALELREAGVDRYNHNVNTSADHHGAITTTHTFVDRVTTIEAVKQAGISPCAGFIAGMGEVDEQLVDVAFELRELDADSIPINFLNAIDGTPLEGRDELDPRRCLKILAMVRFVNPRKEIRVAGGREVNLRSLQPLALYPANAIFVGDYLTTPGQAAEADWQMLEDLGFEIEECAL
jgi:biotin synthase